MQGIIILNVSSYGGGANLWGRSAASSPALHNPWASRSSVLGHSSSSHGSTSPPSASHGTGEDDEWLPITQPDEFVVPSYNDGVLEIVAVTGSLHLAKTQGTHGRVPHPMPCCAAASPLCCRGCAHTCGCGLVPRQSGWPTHDA